MLTSLASYLTNILEKQHFNLIYVLADAILISIGIIIGGILNNIFVSLFLILLLSGGTSLLFGYYIYSFAGISIKDFWLPIRKLLVFTFPLIMINIILINILHSSELVHLIISVAILLLNYFLLFFFGSELKEYSNKAIGYIKNRLKTF